MVDIHQKYDFLLHPIKDLMKNWQIDIAGVLEDYLDEILKMTFSFDGGKTRLNFAEASFLIQGTACVWSRKVEYLHALVYQTLEMISSNKHAQQPGSIDPQGTDKDATFDDHEDKFLNLDDVGSLFTKRWIGSGENILPLPLRSDVFDRADADNRGTALLNEKGETVNYFYDFWANSTTPLDRGMAVIEKPFGGVDMETNDKVERMANEKQRQDLDELSANVDPFDIDDDDRHDDGAGVAFEGDVDMKDDLEAVDEKIVDDNKNMVVERRELRQRALATASNDPKSHFAPPPTVHLNPHDECAAWACKNFRKGKTIKLPPSLPQSARKRKKEPEVVGSIPLFNVFVESIQKSMKGEGTRAMRDEKKKRDAWWKKIRAAQRQADHRDNVEARFDDVFDDRDANKPLDTSDAEDASDGVGADLDDLVDEVMERSGARLPDLPEQLSNDHVTLDTYEDLVRHHVEQFYASAKLFQQETALARRVKQWEVSIAPALEEQDDRPEFDIHKYGDCLMSRFADVGEEKYFCALTAGDNAWSICRKFAATLQLANDNNFELDTEGESLHESLNTLKLKLVSHQRSRDRLDDYVPLS